MTKGFAEDQQFGLTGAPYEPVTGFAENRAVGAKLKLGPGGRVVIPVAFRDALGVTEGDALMATLEGGEVKLVSLAESVRRAQAMVRARVPAGVSLVDELLEDRRQEVLRERSRG
jgi:bifunctional DNA-binding transcriptional regulator/antitoxin component of YhaV-PrlF toxin-antitoxin module